MEEDTPKKGRVFVVQGVEYEDPEDVDLGEMCEAEQHFGVDFNAPNKSARMLTATIYIAVKRKNPLVTPEDIKKLKSDDFEVKEEEVKPDPEVSPISKKPQLSSETTPESSANGGGGLDAIPVASGPLSSETSAT